MSTSKKIANSVEATKGRMKKAFGRATRNRSLEAEGRAEIKDAFKD